MLRRMKYRLAVFDIDGTLIGPRANPSEGAAGRAVPESAAKAIKQLIGLGVTVAVGTARPYSASLRPLGEWDIRSETIASSGADVRREDGSVVVQHPFPDETARFLAELCDRAAWTPSVATVDGMILKLDETPDWLGRAPEGTRVVRRLATDVPKGMLSIVTGVEGESGFVEELNGHADLSTELALTSDGSQLVSVTAAGVDKGTGLVALCGALGIQPGEAVAFGDSEVDIPMFKAAGLSVAMGNSTAETKAQADTITSGVDEDGIAHAVEEIWGA